MPLSTCAPPSQPIWTFEPRQRLERPACAPEQWTDRIRSQGAELGFAGLGFAPVEPFEDAQRALKQWLDAGYHGTMAYMATGSRHDPGQLAPGARSLIVGAVAASARGEFADPAEAPVARYASGRDYHIVLKQKLSALGQAVADLCGRTVSGRACVDTAPLLEREAARRAGLGFIGKSNLLIMPGLGSQVLLGALLIDVPLAADKGIEQRCGRCTQCLDACPTRAFVGPWLLDARRCISYLTIEYRGWIDVSLRPLMGTRVFGCDVCQDVCPYNRGKGSLPSRRADEGAVANITLATWLTLTSSDYRRITAGTALRRASRWQLLRNAAIAAGNSGDFALLEPLGRLLMDSKYSIVRGHAAWALGQLGTEHAVRRLNAALLQERDAQVEVEIRAALSRAAESGR